jgi:hypothetical protein
MPDILDFSFSSDPSFGDLEPIDSSCVEAAGWTFESSGVGDLHIDFTDGTSYTYHNVSPLVYANLLRALSKGWFFNRYIRNNYDFTRES